MDFDVHSSLPVEYQLEYGTAFGNADLTQFVNNPQPYSFGGANSGFLDEILLRHLKSDAGAIVIDSCNPLLISPKGV